MRMRKKKHGEERLSACSAFLAKEEDVGALLAGAPRVYLEIGAGKGGFACGMAERDPAALYLAIERVSDCVVLATEKAKALSEEGHDLSGLRFFVGGADDLLLLLPEGSVDAIYLNFSDPWPKKGYAKRRLTHRRYLSLYFNLLKDGGKLCFKTDNVGLFDFSLEEIAALGLSPSFLTRDLHATERRKTNVMTEYEAAFSAAGTPINALDVEKPAGFSPAIPEELTREGRAREIALAKERHEATAARRAAKKRGEQ